MWLYKAAEKGRLEVARRLLAALADPNAARAVRRPHVAHPQGRDVLRAPGKWGGGSVQPLEAPPPCHLPRTHPVWGALLA